MVLSRKTSGCSSQDCVSNGISHVSAFEKLEHIFARVQILLVAISIMRLKSASSTPNALVAAGHMNP